MATSLDDEEDLVVQWAIRLDGEPLSHAERRALDGWLSEDGRRAGALLRAQAAISYLDRGRALSAPAEPTRQEQVNDDRPRFARRGLLLGGGALAGLVAASLAGLLIFTPSADIVRTRLGEIRRVRLSDGSLASLNTDSKIAVTMANHVRHVTLDEGEAFFQVSHDKVRPFIVAAGDVRVEAVGTAFSVRRRSDGADVLVTEGAVEAWVVGRESERKRIAAGARGFVADAARAIDVERAPEKVDRALAWRLGEIAVDGESLEYAVEEINRYNGRKIVIDDPALAKEPLVGYFRTNDPENFCRAVANIIGARLVDEGDTIHLVRATS